MGVSQDILHEGVDFGKRGGTVIADQGLYSASNFLLNIFLARSLVPNEYGAFALAFAIYALVFRLYSALLIEPMSVFLPNQDDGLRRHFSEHFWLHVLLTLPAQIMIILAGLLALGMDPLRSAAPTIMLFGVMIQFVLLYGLLRQMVYIRQRQGAALLASLVYFIGIVGGLFLVSEILSLSAVGGVLLMGLFNLVGCGVLAIKLGLRIDRPSKEKSLILLKDNWVYGKWMVVSAFCLAAATEVPLFLVSSVGDLTAAGAVKVAQNIIRPVQIVVTSLASIGLPLLSRDLMNGKAKKFDRSFSLMKVAMFGSTFVFAMLVIGFQTEIDQWVFRSQYREYSLLFSLWALISILYSLFHGYGILSKVSQQPKLFAAASGLILIVTVPVSLAFLPISGVWGVTFAQLLGYVFGVLGLLAIWQLHGKKNIGVAA